MLLGASVQPRLQDRSVLGRAGRVVALRGGSRSRTGGIGASGRHAPYPTEIFTGMLVYDSFTVYFRMFLLAFAVLFVILDADDRASRQQTAPISTRWCLVPRSACASWPRPIIC